MRRVIVAMLFCGTAILSACGGGGSGGGTWTPPSPQPSASPTSTPTQAPTQAPGSVNVSPASEEFTATGASYAQTITVTQSGYTGKYGESDNCTGVATVAAGSTDSTFVVTPVAAGTCQATFTGSSAQATLSIGVTTSSVGVQ